MRSTPLKNEFKLDSVILLCRSNNSGCSNDFSILFCISHEILIFRLYLTSLELPWYPHLIFSLMLRLSSLATALVIVNTCSVCWSDSFRFSFSKIISTPLFFGSSHFFGGWQFAISLFRSCLFRVRWHWRPACLWPPPASNRNYREADYVSSVMIERSAADYTFSAMAFSFTFLLDGIDEYLIKVKKYSSFL